ncbi:hypothetical protein KKA14_01350 [bacterium]|nr:hypothetical protein [bacterium]
MKKEDIAYCGLNCEVCKSNFADIRQKIKTLDEAFEKVNVVEMVKVIPYYEAQISRIQKIDCFFQRGMPRMS